MSMTVRASVLMLVLAASCGGDSNDFGEEASSQTLEGRAAESMTAARTVAEVRRAFVVYPPPALSPEALSTPSPVLSPSLANGFEVDGRHLVPLFGDGDSGHTASARLPLRASDEIMVTDVESGLSVTARLEGASNAPAEVADGFVVYPGALDGVDAIHRVRRDGLEDYFHVSAPLPTPEVGYQIALSSDVAGLRLVAGTLELLDAGGVPGLRVARPYLVDTAGTVHDAELDLEGCAVDTDPRPPWGRDVVAPGARTCRVRVTWSDEGLQYPILLDPSWTNTGSMVTPRWVHAAHVLPSGDVLVAGGANGGGFLSSAEIYDPSSNTWSSTGSMSNSRGYFQMASVATGGTTYILAAGGYGNCSGGPHCNQAERYNTSAGTWSSAGTMSYRRVLPALNVLTDGSGKALISGGYDSTGAQPTAELYTPSTNSWATTGSMSTARYGHASAALSSTTASEVIVAGGLNSSGTYLTAAERYTPSSGTWSGAGTTGARYSATATRVAGDYVILVGGQSSSTTCEKRSYRYNPGTPPSWSAIASVPVSAGVCYHAAALLDDGTVMVAGGLGTPTGPVLKNVFTYDVIADSWTTRPSLAAERAGHTATLYPASPTSRVLEAGGADGTNYLSGEYYTP